MKTRKARILGFAVFAAALIAIAYCSLCEPRVTVFDSPLIPRICLPLISKNYRPPDLRFGLTEYGAAEMAILDLPEDGRYHSQMTAMPDATNSAFALIAAHRSHAASRWCTVAYAFAGKSNYCSGGEASIASTGGWVEIDAFSLFIFTHPSRAYIVGNELTCPEPCGSGVTPAEYAVWYADAWNTIKALDQTAKVAPFAPILDAMGKDNLLDVWDAYLALTGEMMPADFYPVHWYSHPGYNLAADIADFEEDIAWLENYRGVKWVGPADYWLTEFGMPTWVYEIPEAELLAFMDDFVHYLMTNDVGVSLWAWWPYGEAALVADGEKTALGDCYYNLAIGQPCE